MFVTWEVDMSDIKATLNCYLMKSFLGLKRAASYPDIIPEITLIVVVSSPEQFWSWSEQKAFDLPVVSPDVLVMKLVK